MANLLFLSAMKDIPLLVNLFPIVLVVNGAFRLLCASNLDNHAMKIETVCVCDCVLRFFGALGAIFYV